MSDKDTYFLTEAVRLVTQGPLVNHIDPELESYFKKQGLVGKPAIVPALEQYGIILKYNDYAHPEAGNFDPELYAKWIEARRQLGERRGWLAKNIRDFGGNYQLRLLKKPFLPPHLMELIRELTDSPSGILLDKIIIDKNKSGIIYPEIQIPFISWLNKNELNRISARLKDLFTNKTSLAIKPLWEFTDLARQVIKGWYIRNNLEIPQNAVPGARGNLWLEFVELVKEALACGPKTDEQLWEWKDRFSELPASYFRRYEKRTGKPLPSTSGLAWWKNPKFRKARTKKSAK